MDKLVRTLINISVAVVFFHTTSSWAKGVNIDLSSGGSRWPVEVIVPVAFFAIFPACLFLIGFFRYKGKREKQLTLRAMAENGAQIPPEMFMEKSVDLDPMDRDRRRGLLFSLSSLGFLTFLLLYKDLPEGIWSISLVPLFLGIGYLINWKLAEKEQR